MTASGFTAHANKQHYLQSSRGVTLTTNVTQDFALDFRQLYTRSGIGDAVFDFVTPDRWQIRIQGQYAENSSPFIVSIDNETVVTFDGIVMLSAGTVVIEKSSGVAWSFTEVR